MDSFRRRVLSTSIIVVALTCAAFAPSALARAGDRPKPDLVITNVRAGGSEWAFKGVDSTISVHYVTKNKGSRRAGRSSSVTSLVPEFAGAHPAKHELVSHHVPALDPGDSDRGGGTINFSTSDLPLGAYDIEVCADYFKKVGEEHEGNNCTSADRGFYVVQEDWEGSVSGDGVVAGAPQAEKWHSGDAHLSFDKYLGNGAFHYDFIGVMQWTDNGTNSGGCTYTGSGSERVNASNSGSDPGITLNYGNARYRGTEALDDHFYTIFVSGFSYCTKNLDGPVALDFLQIPVRSLRFNQNELNGTFSEPGIEGTTWNWDFG
jgi:CARDB